MDDTVDTKKMVCEHKSLKGLDLRILIFILTILIPTAALGQEGPREHVWGVSSATEQVIAEFQTSDVTYIAGDCAVYGGNAALDADCTVASTRLYVTSAWTVTRIEAWVGTLPWTNAGLNKSCDVDIDFNTTTTATFQFGSVALGGPGEYEVRTTFVDDTLAAGDYINVRHDTSVPNTYCPQEENCVCTNTSAHYGIRIIGAPGG